MSCELVNLIPICLSLQISFYQYVLFNIIHCLSLIATYCNIVIIGLFTRAWKWKYKFSLSIFREFNHDYNQSETNIPEIVDTWNDYIYFNYIIIWKTTPTLPHQAYFPYLCILSLYLCTYMFFIIYQDIPIN